MPTETAVHVESGIAKVCAWLALAAAFVLSWTTWVGVGDIAEYGAFAYALPICVDGYIVTTLMAWIAPRDSKTHRFARWNVYLSAGLSILTQSVYHGALVYSHTSTPWKALIAWLAGALPPLFAALSVHFRTGVQRIEPQPVTSESPTSEATAPSAPQSPPSVPIPAGQPTIAAPTPPPPAPSLPTSPSAVPPSIPVQRAAPDPPPVTTRPVSVATAPLAATRQVKPARERRIMPTKAGRAKQPPRRPAHEEAARKESVMRLLDAEAASGVRITTADIGRRTGVSQKTIERYRLEHAARRNTEPAA